MSLGEALAVRDMVANRVTSSTDGVPWEKSRTIAERLLAAGYIDIEAMLAHVRADNDDEDDEL